MLSYAFTTLNQGGYEDVATEEFENIHNLFAAILAKGISRQLKEGLSLYQRRVTASGNVAVSGWRFRRLTMALLRHNGSVCQQW